MTVQRLGNRNNSYNVPHMLRTLADSYERGMEKAPRTVLLVCLGDPDYPPEIWKFGADSSRLEDIGAFSAAVAKATEV